MLKIYLVQMESKPLAKEQNLEKAHALVRGAHPEPGGLIIFPEMFATGYIPKDIDKESESFEGTNPGLTTEFLEGLARETQCTVIGGGIKKKDGKYTNHSSVIGKDGAEIAGYDKLRTFFSEKDSITAGSGITLFKTNGFTIATTICYDLRFPEIYRKATRDGATLFTVQAAWPNKRLLHWETLVKARAIENQAFVAAVNCVSRNGIYSGCSMLVDPFGNTVIKAESGVESVICAEIDEKIEDRYRKDFPVLSDM